MQKPLQVALLKKTIRQILSHGGARSVPAMFVWVIRMWSSISLPYRSRLVPGNGISNPSPRQPSIHVKSYVPWFTMYEWIYRVSTKCVSTLEQLQPLWEHQRMVMSNTFYSNASSWRVVFSEELSSQRGCPTEVR